MSKGSINVGSRSYECRVIVDQITAQGGYSNYTLYIPVKIDLNHNEKLQILAVIGELRATKRQFRVSESFNLLSHRIYNNVSYNFTFHFPLTDNILANIEKERAGNLPLSLNFTIQFGILQDGIFNTEGSKSDTHTFIAATETSSSSISFEIEQSYWVRKTLDELQYPSFKLIELPISNEIIPKEYKDSLNELEEAKSYFVKGDYDKTIAHCRTAIEPFKRKLPEIKEFVKSKSEFEWANSVLNATEEWLEKIIKSTSSFTSKSHHFPSIGHFGRTDAEIVMMITTGLIAYIGKIRFKSE